MDQGAKLCSISAREKIHGLCGTKFVVVAAMVGQQLPCALRRAMCPASGGDAVRRHFFTPRPFLPGQLHSLIHPFPVLRVPSRSQGLAAVLHPVLVGSRSVPGFMATLGRSPCSPPFPRWQSQIAK